MVERLDHFELHDELGTGGMGTVYRSVDTGTGKTVALKVLHPHLAKDPDYVRRFEREARIAKALDSPHTVSVLDYGQDGGQHYLAMEYVEGESLAQLLRERGKLPPEEARSIATQVALALEAAHRKGIVHRDIKPGNILIAPDGTAKVADFGIARDVDSTTITKTGFFVGTLSYAAPELLAGKSDIRSDIYSLGVVLYQMLSGRVPFEAETPLELIDMHRSQEPPTLESLGVAVPPDLRAIVTRCLVKKPEERYQEPGELLAVLEGKPVAGAAAVPVAGAGDGGAPPPPTLVWRGSDWFGGRRMGYVLLGAGAAGVVLAAVLVTAAATGGWGGGRADEGAGQEAAVAGTPVATPGAVGGFASLCQKSSDKQFSAPPPTIIDPARSYTAVIKTEKGDITVELYPDSAPVTVNNFVFLACKGFYDGVTWHRVISGFVAQTGDPTGTGSGGPGYKIQDEISTRPFEKGTLGMANAGPNTNGSQFFICLAPQPNLNGKYTAFGKVTSGMDVVQRITPRDPSTNPNAPPGDEILDVTIEER